MSGPVVAITHGDEPRRMVREALELIRAEAVVPRDGAVVVKPNYVEPMMPDTGVTTDPRVIEAVVEWLQELGVRRVTVAESAWDRGRTERAFEMVGLPEMARRRGIALLNLFDDQQVEVQIENAHSLDRVLLSRTVLEADCLITLPKLKCHSMAGVTLGIKNLMGAVFPDKELMHRDLSQRLCDLASVLKPKLCVIDGLIGSERHETAGSPVKTDVVIAGRDVVATDVVGALVMGMDATRIEHLGLCGERGLGEHRPEMIEVVGAPVEKVRKQYRHSRW